MHPSTGLVLEVVRWHGYRSGFRRCLELAEIAADDGGAETALQTLRDALTEMDKTWDAEMMVDVS